MRRHPRFRRFLVGTDGSSSGDEAVRQAAQLARLVGAELEIVHVAHPQPVQLGAPGPARLRAADEWLAAARRIAAAHHVTSMSRLLVGEPAHELAEEAKRTWTDLVFVGADAGFLHHPHLQGGIAAHLVHLGVRPTVVCRPAHQRGIPRRVLVAVDGSPASTEAARLAAAVIASAGGSLRILHVVPHGARPGWDDDAQPRGFDALEEARAVADSMGVAAAVELTEGMPGPAVAAAATRWDADLIATGDRGRSAAQRLALGSVSTWLMRHLDRSLLVARRPA